MEFGIGFLAGGLLTGIAVANFRTLLKGTDELLAKLKLIIQRKVASDAASVKAKL